MVGMGFFGANAKRRTLALIFSILINIFIFSVFFDIFSATIVEHKDQPHKKQPPIQWIDEFNDISGIGSGSTTCKNKYKGVGLKFNPYTGEVTEVPVGTPAYKAGFKLGDLLNLDELMATERTLGKAVAVKVLRGEKELTLFPIVDWVCEL